MASLDMSALIWTVGSANAAVVLTPDTFSDPSFSTTSPLILQGRRPTSINCWNICSFSESSSTVEMSLFVQATSGGHQHSYALIAPAGTSLVAGSYDIMVVRLSQPDPPAALLFRQWCRGIRILRSAKTAQISAIISARFRQLYDLSCAAEALRLLHPAAMKDKRCDRKRSY
jgi:hypothetical protein